MKRLRTAVARARSSARHSSALDRANARRGSAKSTGSGPRPAPACSLRLQRSLCIVFCGLRLGGGPAGCFLPVLPLAAVVLLPAPLLLPRFGAGAHRVGRFDLFLPAADHIPNPYRLPSISGR